MSEVFAREGASAEVPDGARPVLLRAAREAAGLHIAALAAALKVPVRKLEALEAGRYDELPDLTFARALASSACRHLKVDPAPILEQIPQSVIPELGGSRHTINAPFLPMHDPAPISPLSWLSRPALLAAIVLLLGALVIVFMPRMEEPARTEMSSATITAVEPAEPVSAVEPVPAQEPAPPGTPAAEGASPAVPAVSAPVSAVPAASTTSVAPSSPTAAPAPALADVAPAVVAASSAGALLTIAATGESWVEVVNGSGNVVVQRVLQAGEAIDFSTAPPYKVVLGRAEAAQVTVRGKPFDVTTIARNNIARFEVK